MDHGGCIVFKNIVITLCFVLIIIFSSNGYFVDCKIVVPGKSSESAVKHKNAVKTIESDDGDVIDCVDIYKQPALDHPLLKNHTIQLEQWYPSPRSARENIGDDHRENFQSWRRNGECPEGTIPILREVRYDRPHAIPSIQKLITHPDDEQLDFGVHEFAVVSLAGTGGTYYGAHADINVWKPATSTGEVSASQIWLIAESSTQLNTLEVGWHVNKPDNRTRFFIYWTADGYQETGCYNLQCPGFVQVSKKIALGALLKPVSVYTGKQYEIGLSIYKDINRGHWWVEVHGEALGYWPETILPYLNGRGADYICWGGEIINNELYGRHTSTQMGSGHFPANLYGKASYFRNVQYFDESGNFKDAENLTTSATKPHCYDVLIMKKKVKYSGVHFYFGGPGYSPTTCHT